MVLTKKQKWCILFLAIAGILIYYFLYKRNKAGANKLAGSIAGQSSYVGPQDCAENCNLPYNNRIIFCYKNSDGMPSAELNACLNKADKLKQDCLGKCDKSLPPDKDLTQIISTLQN